MDATLLKTIGQVAGLGGIALGVLMLVFRDVIRRQIFPQLAKAQAYRLIRLIIVLTFAIAFSGLTAWVYVSKTKPIQDATAESVLQIDRIEARMRGELQEEAYTGCGVTLSVFINGRISRFPSTYGFAAWEQGMAGGKFPLPINFDATAVDPVVIFDCPNTPGDFDFDVDWHFRGREPIYITNTAVNGTHVLRLIKGDTNLLGHEVVVHYSVK